jgi:hypothetical protein
LSLKSVLHLAAIAIFSAVLVVDVSSAVSAVSVTENAINKAKVLKSRRSSFKLCVLPLRIEWSLDVISAQSN